MKMIFRLGSLAATTVFVANSVFAGSSCVFARECFEDETCTDASFLVAFSISACPLLPGPRSIMAKTDFGDLTGQEIAQPCVSGDMESENQSYYLTGEGAAYFLTVADDQARLAVHMDGPLAVNYLGTCEAITP